jgi:AcrR family transcriptional regulator
MTGRVRKTAEERKSEIVETALRLADKVGPERLTTDSVAAAVGVTQAAIFRHFPKKQDLWEAVAHRIGEKYRVRWAEAETAPGSLAQVRRLVDGQLRLVEATPAIPAILFSRELHSRNQALRRVFAELMRQFHGRILRSLEAAQLEGLVRADIDPADQAYLVIGLGQSLILRWSLSGREFDLSAEGRRLLDLQLACFGAPAERSGP